MLKLGAGLGHGFELDGFNGFSLPLVLGAERRLSDHFSAYANLVTALHLVHGRSVYNDPLINRGIVELGGRYYYNQAKRMQRRKPAGPFVGNYLALQASTDVVPYYQQAAINKRELHIEYSYSAISALWGMQRRINNLFLFDFNTGIAVYNEKYARYDAATESFAFYREPTPLIELNVRLSLVR